MNITFITNLRHLTYKHYLEQAMSMIERVLNKKLNQNPELINKTNKITPPNNSEI